jgi:hypothetical protein
MIGLRAGRAGSVLLYDVWLGWLVGWAVGREEGPRCRTWALGKCLCEEMGPFGMLKWSVNLHGRMFG